MVPYLVDSAYGTEAGWRSDSVGGGAPEIKPTENRTDTAPRCVNSSHVLDTWCTSVGLTSDVSVPGCMNVADARCGNGDGYVVTSPRFFHELNWILVVVTSSPSQVRASAPVRP